MNSSVFPCRLRRPGGGRGSVVVFVRPTETDLQNISGQYISEWHGAEQNSTACLTNKVGRYIGQNSLAAETGYISPLRQTVWKSRGFAEKNL